MMTATATLTKLTNRRFDPMSFKLSPEEEKQVIEFIMNNEWKFTSNEFEYICEYKPNGEKVIGFRKIGEPFFDGKVMTFDDSPRGNEVFKNLANMAKH